LLGISQDVTERKRAERALRESQQLLQAIIDNSTAVIYVKDLQGSYLMVNRRYEEIFHLTREAVLGKTDHDVFSQEAADAFRAMDQRVVAAGTALTEEEVAPHDDGPHTYISVKCPLWDNAGKPYAVFGISTDITERKRLEQQLLQSQRMEAVGRLAGGVAHDFNNLLTVIIGESELMLASLAPNDPLRAQIEAIDSSAQRAADLTRQLLAFSRKQVLQPKVLDLNTIVTDLGKMLRRLIGEDVELINRLSSNLGRVKADPGQIEQIIVNLAINARDAMPRGGTLTIETNNTKLDDQYASQHPEVRPGDQVMLAVSDTGTGMDREMQSRIFEPFFTTKERGKGTGLGLATVYGVVKQSEGHIWVYSEPGRGTTFKVYLPKVEEPAEVTRRSAGRSSSAGGSETVLVVEDDDGVRGVVRQVMSSAGYTVMECKNAEQALSMSGSYSGHIHLMVTDVIMPGASGRELAQKITALRPGIRVLYMSGYTDNAIVHHGVLDEGVAFIEKPFTPDRLLHKVREVLNT